MVWIRASEFCRKNFTCDAKGSDDAWCGRAVAWIIAKADGSGPLIGVCHRHRGVTRAFVLTEYGP